MAMEELPAPGPGLVAGRRRAPSTRNKAAKRLRADCAYQVRYPAKGFSGGGTSGEGLVVGTTFSRTFGFVGGVNSPP